MEKDIKLVLNIMVHYDDDWYGINKRFLYAGPENKGFATKGEARAHTSMFNKYIKSELKNARRVSGVNKLSIDNFKDLETYRYNGPGPSWSCSNKLVDHTHFMKFVEKETARLEENRAAKELLRSINKR